MHSVCSMAWASLWSYEILFSLSPYDWPMLIGESKLAPWRQWIIHKQMSVLMIKWKRKYIGISKQSQFVQSRTTSIKKKRTNKFVAGTFCVVWIFMEFVRGGQKIYLVLNAIFISHFHRRMKLFPNTWFFVVVVADGRNLPGLHWIGLIHLSVKNCEFSSIIKNCPNVCLIWTHFSRAKFFFQNKNSG